MGDLARLRAALRPNTRLVVVETPSNPLLNVVDLAGAIAIAREHGARTLVDNTFATPALQRPIESGADVVLHSTTKYLGGHSDVQGGALVFARRDELYEKTAHARHVLGPVASPFNCWLVLRGIRTLACRMAMQSATALAVARALEQNEAVAAVHYPGLPSHPRHDRRAGRCRASGRCCPSARAAAARPRSARSDARVCSCARRRWAGSRA